MAEIRLPVSLEITNLLKIVRDLLSLLGSLKVGSSGFNNLLAVISSLEKEIDKLLVQVNRPFISANLFTLANRSIEKIEDLLETVQMRAARIKFSDLELNTEQAAKLKEFETAIDNIRDGIKKVKETAKTDFLGTDLGKLWAEIDVSAATRTIDQLTSRILSSVDLQQRALNNAKKALKDYVSSTEISDLLKNALGSDNPLKAMMSTEQYAQFFKEVRGKLKFDTGQKPLFADWLQQNFKLDKSTITSIMKSSADDILAAFADPQSNLRLIIQGKINRTGDTKYADLTANVTLANAELEKRLKILTGVTNAANSVNPAIENYNDLIKQISGEQKNWEKSVIQTNLNLWKGGEAAQSASTNLNSLRGTLAAANAEFIKTQSITNSFNSMKSLVANFMGFTQVLNLVKRGVKEAMTHIQDLDSVMNKISIVTDLSTGDLWNLVDAYSKMASSYGVSIKGAYEVSQIYYQLGLETADVLTLTNETLKLAKISGLDYASTTDYMTTALRGFKMEMSEASTVVDVYSALAAHTAVSLEELAVAMSKTASSMLSVGSTFQETSAMIGTMVAVTRESATNIGSAMKSIASRYGELTKDPTKLVDADGEALAFNKVDAALQSVGISMRTTDGQFREFTDVITELGEKWGELDSTQQRYIATQFAGNRQQSRFLALVSNVDLLKSNMRVANDSEDTGTIQAYKALDSIETKIELVRVAYQQFYTTIGAQDVWKAALDGMNTYITNLNNLPKLFGKVPVGAIAMIANIVSLIKTAGTSIIGWIAKSWNDILPKDAGAKAASEFTESFTRESASGESAAKTVGAAMGKGLIAGMTEAAAESSTVMDTAMRGMANKTVETKTLAAKVASTPNVPVTVNDLTALMANNGITGQLTEGFGKIDLTNLEAAKSLISAVFNEIAAKSQEASAAFNAAGTDAIAQYVSGILVAQGQAKDAADTIANSVAESFNALNVLNSSNIGQLLSDAIKGTNIDLTDVTEGTQSALNIILSNIINASDDIRKAFLAAGQDGGAGYVQGLLQSMGASAGAAAQLGQATVQALRASILSNSPSKVTMQVGQDFAAGFRNGTLAGTGDAGDAGSELGKAALEGLKTGAISSELFLYIQNKMRNYFKERFNPDNQEGFILKDQMDYDKPENEKNTTIREKAAAELQIALNNIDKMTVKTFAQKQFARIAQVYLDPRTESPVTIAEKATDLVKDKKKNAARKREENAKQRDQRNSAKKRFIDLQSEGSNSKGVVDQRVGIIDDYVYDETADLYDEKPAVADSGTKKNENVQDKAPVAEYTVDEQIKVLERLIEARKKYDEVEASGDKEEIAKAKAEKEAANEAVKAMGVSTSINNKALLNKINRLKAEKSKSINDADSSSEETNVIDIKTDKNSDQVLKDELPEIEVPIELETVAKQKFAVEELFWARDDELRAAKSQDPARRLKALDRVRTAQEDLKQYGYEDTITLDELDREYLRLKRKQTLLENEFGIGLDYLTPYKILNHPRWKTTEQHPEDAQEVDKKSSEGSVSVSKEKEIKSSEPKTSELKKDQDNTESQADKKENEATAPGNGEKSTDKKDKSELVINIEEKAEAIVNSVPEATEQLQDKASKEAIEVPVEILEIDNKISKLKEFLKARNDLNEAKNSKTLWGEARKNSIAEAKTKRDQAKTELKLLGISDSDLSSNNNIDKMILKLEALKVEITAKLNVDQAEKLDVQVQANKGSVSEAIDEMQGEASKEALKVPVNADSDDNKDKDGTGEADELMSVEDKIAVLQELLGAMKETAQAEDNGDTDAYNAALEKQAEARLKVIDAGLNGSMNDELIQKTINALKGETAAAEEAAGAERERKDSTTSSVASQKESSSSTSENTVNIQRNSEALRENATAAKAAATAKKNVGNIGNWVRGAGLLVTGISGLIDKTEDAGVIASDTLSLLGGTANLIGSIMTKAGPLAYVTAGLTVITGIISFFKDASLESRIERSAKLAETLTRVAKEEKANANLLKSSIDELNELKEKRYESAEAAEAYLNKVDELAEKFPQLVTGFDDTGNAIIEASNMEHLLADARRESAKAAYEAALQEKNTSELLLLQSKEAVDAAINGLNASTEYNQQQDIADYNLKTVLSALGANEGETLNTLGYWLKESKFGDYTLERYSQGFSNDNGRGLDMLIGAAWDTGALEALTKNKDIISSEALERIENAMVKTSDGLSKFDYQRYIELFDKEINKDSLSLLEKNLLEVSHAAQAVSETDVSEKTSQSIQELYQKASNLLSGAISENWDIDNIANKYTEVRSEIEKALSEGLDVTALLDALAPVEEAISNYIKLRAIDLNNAAAVVNAYIRQTYGSRDAFGENTGLTTITGILLQQNWTSGEYKNLTFDDYKRKQSSYINEIINNAEQFYNQLSGQYLETGESYLAAFARMVSDSEHYTAEDIIKELHLELDPFAAYLTEAYHQRAEDIQTNLINNINSKINFRKNKSNTTLFNLKAYINTVDRTFSTIDSQYYNLMASLIDSLERHGWDNQAHTVYSAMKSMDDVLQLVDEASRNAILDSILKNGIATTEGIAKTRQVVQALVDSGAITAEQGKAANNALDAYTNGIVTNLSLSLDALTTDFTEGWADKSKNVKKLRTGIDFTEVLGIIDEAASFGVEGFSLKTSDFIQSGNTLVLTAEKASEYWNAFIQYNRGLGSNLLGKLDAARQYLLNEQGQLKSDWDNNEVLLQKSQDSTEFMEYLQTILGSQLSNFLARDEESGEIEKINGHSYLDSNKIPQLRQAIAKAYANDVDKLAQYTWMLDAAEKQIQKETQWDEGDYSSLINGISFAIGTTKEEVLARLTEVANGAAMDEGEKADPDFKAAVDHLKEKWEEAVNDYSSRANALTSLISDLDSISIGLKVSGELATILQLIGMADANGVVTSVQLMADAYLRIYELMQNQSGATLSLLNSAYASILNANSKAEVDAIKVLENAMGLTYDDLAEIFTAYGKNLSEIFGPDGSIIQNIGITGIGNGKLRVDDFSAFADYMDWAPDSEEYINALKSYNDNIITLATKVQDLVVDELINVTSAHVGDLVNVTLLQDVLSKANINIDKYLQQAGIRVEEGIWTITNTANIPLVMQLVSDRLARAGQLIPSQMAELNDAITTALTTIAGYIKNGISGSLGAADAGSLMAWVEGLNILTPNGQFKLTQADFSLTAEGVKLTTDAFNNMYAALKSVNSEMAQVMLLNATSISDYKDWNTIMTTLTDNYERMSKYQSRTTAETALQKSIIPVDFSKWEYTNRPKYINKDQSISTVDTVSTTTNKGLTVVYTQIVDADTRLAEADMDLIDKKLADLLDASELDVDIELTSGATVNLKDLTVGLYENQTAADEASTALHEYHAAAMEGFVDMSTNINKTTTALQNQQVVLKDLISTMMNDSDSFNFMSGTLPGDIQAGVNLWENAASAMSTLTTAGKNGYIGVLDFYNIVTTASGLMSAAGKDFYVNGMNAAELIEAAVGKIKIVDGKAQIDLSGMGIDVNGVNDLKSNLTDGINSLAKAEVEMLDAEIKIFEVLAAMEALGDVDVDMDGISFELDDIFEFTNDGTQFTGDFQQYLTNLKSVADSMPEVEAALKSIKFGGATFYELLEGGWQDWKEAGFSQETLARFFADLSNTDWDIENLSEQLGSIFGKLNIPVEIQTDTGFITISHTGKMFNFDFSNEEINKLLADLLGIEGSASDIEKAVRDAWNTYNNADTWKTISVEEQAKVLVTIGLASGSYTYSKNDEGLYIGTYNGHTIGPVNDLKALNSLVGSLMAQEEQGYTIQYHTDGTATATKTIGNATIEYVWGVEGSTYKVGNQEFDSEAEAINYLATRGWADLSDSGKRYSYDGQSVDIWYDSALNATYGITTTTGEYVYNGMTFGNYNDLADYITYINPLLNTHEFLIDLSQSTKGILHIYTNGLAKITHNVANGLFTYEYAGTEFANSKVFAEFMAAKKLAEEDGLTVTTANAPLEFEFHSAAVQCKYIARDGAMQYEADIVIAGENHHFSANDLSTLGYAIDASVSALENKPVGIESSNEGTLQFTIDGKSITVTVNADGLVNIEGLAPEDPLYKTLLETAKLQLENQSLGDMNTSIDTVTAEVKNALLNFTGTTTANIPIGITTTDAQTLLEAFKTTIRTTTGVNLPVGLQTSAAELLLTSLITLIEVTRMINIAANDTESRTTVGALLKDIEDSIVEFTVKSHDEGAEGLIEKIQTALAAITGEHEAKVTVKDETEEAKEGISKVENDSYSATIDVSAPSETAKSEIEAVAQGDYTAKIKVEVDMPDLPSGMKITSGNTDNSNSATGNIGLAKATGNASVNVSGSMRPPTNDIIDFHGGYVHGQSRAAGTLMGELGPELVVSNGRYFVVGLNGAEFVDLASDAIVFNHLQTEQLLKKGMSSSRGKAVTNEREAASFAKGNVHGGDAMASASSILAQLKKLRAMWSQLATSSVSDLAGTGGSGGGGGGSDDNNSEFLKDLERWYNWLLKIAELEDKINYYEAERTRISSDWQANGRDYYNSQRKSLSALEEEVATQRSLAESQQEYFNQRREQMNSAGNAFSRFYTFDENGQLKYTNNSFTYNGQTYQGGLAALAEIQRTDAHGERVHTNEEQLSMFKAWLGEDVVNQYSTDSEGNERTTEEILEALWTAMESDQSEMQSLHDSINSANEEVQNLLNQLNELLKEMRDNQMDLENKVYNAIVDTKQRMIDELQDNRDATSDANTKFIKGLNNALSKERQMYENALAQQDLDKLRARRDVLVRSGGSAAEIASLNDEIADQEQSLYFDKLQELIDAILAASDKQLEKMDAEIAILTETLDYQKKYGLLWANVTEIMSKSPEEIANYIMVNDQEYWNKSPLATAESLNSLRFSSELWASYRDDALMADIQQLVTNTTPLSNDSSNSNNNNSNSNSGNNNDSNNSSNSGGNSNSTNNTANGAGSNNERTKVGGLSDWKHNAEKHWKELKWSDGTVTKELSAEHKFEASGSSGGFRCKVCGFFKQETNSANPTPPSQEQTDSIKWKVTGTRPNGESGIFAQGYTSKAKAEEGAEAAKKAMWTNIKILSYDKGGLIKGDQLAMVHDSEAIFTKELTKVLRDNILSNKPNSLVNLLRSYNDAYKGLSSSTYDSITNNTNSGTNIDKAEVNLNIDKLANDYDAKRAANTVMEEMLRIASKTSANNSRRR